MSGRRVKALRKQFIEQYGRAPRKAASRHIEKNVTGKGWGGIWRRTVFTANDEFRQVKNAYRRELRGRP